MKVAHIVCTFPPYYGGMGNSVFDIATNLIAKGIDVEIFTPYYEEITEEVHEAVTRLSPYLKKGNAAWMPQIKSRLQHFDIVHLHYPFFGTATAVYRFKKQYPDIPLVVTYHMDTRSPGLKGLFFAAYAKFWMPKILHAADALIGTSFDYISQSMAQQNFNAEKEKWHEISLGVDMHRFSPQDKNVYLAAQHDIAINAPTILFVGGMDQAHYFKGLPVLINAFAEVKKHIPTAQLILVGEGDQQEMFRAQAKILRVSDAVKFVGKVPAELLPEIYRMADVLALPSTTQGEAFGMVLLEALASGIEVIASDLPGVRTIVESIGGQVVSPQDINALTHACISVLETPRTSNRVADILDFVRRNYTWERIAQEHIDLYTSLLKK